MRLRNPRQNKQGGMQVFVFSPKSKIHLKAPTPPFNLQFSSIKRIPIQLHLISPLCPRSLCPRFDFCFWRKIAVKSKTLLKHGVCCVLPSPRNPPLMTPHLCLSACGRTITGEEARRNKLTSSSKCLILQNGIIRSLRRRSSYCKLLLFSLLEFISWNGERGCGGWGGGAERGGDKAKRLSFREKCSQIGKLLWSCLHSAGYGRLMWNFTANKSGQRGRRGAGEEKSQRGQSCGLLREASRGVVW